MAYPGWRITAIGLAALAMVSGTAQAQTTPQEAADALFTAEDWTGAAAAYEALLAGDPDNAANWFSLGRARHSAEQQDAARTAYLRALEAGFTPAGRAQYHLARALMALGETEAALAQIEAMAEAGTPIGSTVQSTEEFAPLAEDARFVAAVAAMTPCTDPVYRGFDFWLGEWNVTATGATVPTARSRISARHGGCVVLEEYEAGGFTGMSINFVDSSTGRWHQSWMANNGVPIYLEGNLNEAGAMVLSDAELPISTATGTINRVTWSREAEGAVRQFWETSSDGGASWTVAFDGLYTPRAPEEGEAGE